MLYALCYSTNHNSNDDEFLTNLDKVNVERREVGIEDDSLNIIITFLQVATTTTITTTTTG